MPYTRSRPCPLSGSSKPNAIVPPSLLANATTVSSTLVSLSLNRLQSNVYDSSKSSARSISASSKDGIDVVDAVALTVLCLACVHPWFQPPCHPCLRGRYYRIQLQQQPARRLEQLDHFIQKSSRRRSVDQTMVVGEAQRHHQPRQHLAVAHYRQPPSAAQQEQGRLAMV